jgi:SpoVK/Ycf46/Vps4 family AAA+-type ATPase
LKAGEIENLVALCLVRHGSLPPEFIRKGRWDEVFFIDLPGPEEREEIMGIILQGRSPALKPDKQWIALTECFSGAEIRQAFEDAGYEAFHSRKPCSSFGLVKASILTTPPPTPRFHPSPG